MAYEPRDTDAVGVPSVNRVLRQLKRQENGLYNCVASVVADAAFVQEVISIVYHNTPVLETNGTDAASHYVALSTGDTQEAVLVVNAAERLTNTCSWCRLGCCIQSCRW